MKLFAIVAVIFWAVCGIAGAWMLGDLDRAHWKVIARGPITLVRAFNENPVTIPTGDDDQ